LNSLPSIQTPVAPAQPIPAASDFAFPWTPDQRNGTYRNPVLYADYSDPDVVRVGADFYLTASSFNCTPGLPVLHSRDLVNWTLIGHAVNNLPHPRYAEVRPGCGIWAPAIRFHADQFWIFFPMPDEGIYLVTAPNPAGPWSEPHLVQAGKGLIDPCPFWDDDGRAWLVHAYAGSRAGIKHRLCVRPMAPDGRSLLGEGQVVFHDPKKHPTLEGPKFLKRDGWYYLSAPAGGVETGWQVVLRSKNILGPYEDKIVLTQGSTAVNGPHQGALVSTADDRWWFVHFQDAGVYGRIVHLQPVFWRDGWPLMGSVNGSGCGEPVVNYQKPVAGHPGSVQVPQTSDEFESDKLGLQWQWHANHEHGWCSLAARPGWLRLFSQASPQGDLDRTPGLLLQKFPARSFAVETRLDFSALPTGGEAGLVVMGRTHAALAVRRTEAAFQIIFRVNHHDHVSPDLSSAEIQLRLRVGDAGVCEFSYQTDHDWVAAPEIFPASAGVWIGAKTGLYCLQSDPLAASGHADFSYFRFSPFAAGQ
jgi:beta-xylosidase